MARVTVEESQRFARSMKGIRMFNFEPGNHYHVLFLGEKTPDGREEPILFMNPTHNIRKDGKGMEVRCANKKYNLSDVVLRNPDGSLKKDPRTGKILNDGTCPYCELEKLYKEMIFIKREQFIKDNPDATKKEISDYTKKLFNKAPVKGVTQARVFLVAVFELDSKGKVKTDSEGKKLYSIQGFKMSEHRFSTKFMEQVEIMKNYICDDDNPNESPIAWKEYYFSFPKAENKMQSGKDMNVSVAPHPVLKSDPDLKKELEEKIKELDLDSLENQIFIYKLKTLEEMNNDIAPLMSLIEENMSPEEIKAAKQKLGKSDVVTEEEAIELMGEDGYQSDEITEQSSESGEKAFEVTESDVEKLL